MHSTPLSGKVIVVAGASSGMGRATALAAASAGAHVVLAARSSAVIAELQAGSVTNGSITADATDRAAVQRLAAAALAVNGRIDALVKSVGANIRKRALDELTAASWAAMLASNLTSAFHLTQSYLFRSLVLLH